MPTWQGKSSGNTLGYSIFVTILKYFGLLPAYILLRVWVSGKPNHSVISIKIITGSDKALLIR
jgi:hypothetical protein